MALTLRPVSRGRVEPHPFAATRPAQIPSHSSLAKSSEVPGSARLPGFWNPVMVPQFGAGKAGFLHLCLKGDTECGSTYEMSSNGCPFCCEGFFVPFKILPHSEPRFS